MIGPNFTPGPWKVVTGTTMRGVNVFSADDFICEVGALNGSRDRDERIEADARLIAAAPDLLAALQGVLRVADRATDEFDAARAAIAKATRTQP